MWQVWRLIAPALYLKEKRFAFSFILMTSLGFIGGGSSLGGAMGAALTRVLVESVGTKTMVLISAAIMGACMAIVLAILKREQAAGTSDASKTGEEEGVGSGEAIRLLRSSRHLQVIGGRHQP